MRVAVALPDPLSSGSISCVAHTSRSEAVTGTSTTSYNEEDGSRHLGQPRRPVWDEDVLAAQALN